MTFEKEEIQQLAHELGKELQERFGIADLDHKLEVLEVENIQLREQLEGLAWHPASEVPEAGLYIICTDKGAVYFSRTDGKKWDNSVRYWKRIPTPPISNADFVQDVFFNP